ncbi:PA3715 family protein [Rhizobium herbae]|uniref:Secreted protein n=1 Tax=Rhizobium herbae TaxID=508661 RepID=A0ABS4EQH4_9HYPH|nr:hypothetical protein [Rhizobium herbae]MBP1860201.1 hypothetical protein [Rhizobium herbae]
MSFQTRCANFRPMMIRAAKIAVLHTLLAAATLLLGMGVSHAADDECGARAKDIVQHAYPNAVKASDTGFTVDGFVITLPEESLVGDDPHAILCRVWPAHPELMLVAVPLVGAQSDDGNTGDLELLVLDAASLDVRQRLRLAGRMSDDAVRITQVAFDTARYQLAPGQMAFGLRIFQHGSSGPNPFGEVGLWLYAIVNGKLVPVLDGITVSDNHGEWDTNCAGTFDETNRTLAMQSTVHNGYADILVSETSSSRVSAVGANGECGDQQVSQKKSTMRLVYDGKQYNVPEASKPLD